MNVSSIPASACAASAIAYPTVFGAEILNLSANLVLNYSSEVSDQYYFNNPSISVRNIDYCNVTVTYTHPGQNDTINVETWLPMKDWNGRLQATGGGGYVAGRFFLSYTAMAGALGNGYVATTTDGELIKEFYGRPAEYSYFTGCSQGGRQGMMLAQRYPEAYDGIAAAAPAFNWARLFPALAWPQVMMELTGQFPQKCELDAVTAGAIATCDPQDGVTDGIISDPAACSFDPFSMVGRIINCDNEASTISNAAAAIANLTWTGPRKANGDFLYYGSPAGLGEAWLKFMVKKDPNWNYSKITSVGEYARLFQASAQEFDSIFGTFDTDLSAFRDAGGKMITYHGTADGLILRQGTNEYYDRATEQTPNIKDFFRYFEVPGLAHCAGGVGGQPTATFQALVDWVEKGVAPDTLPINFKDTNGTQYERILCPYPEKAQLVSADLDVTKAESYKCGL
ncbi:tannase and feruloyl esterase [Aspergillus novofumigatus IBT 16806]|uniref:Carboxylic ester hydrolase n=1 Tax=Aspergillus novofumigatus (strain IBT 16806) TaxID=1392255 RepID=A0A2I1BYT0_ASPN1|nr:tannase and feruloyl esterase [Aspergillus novofumigatus IBT 16806]PKX90532.1 tannase and feruloyl esterase [Aspergillus novofumigatus IBT 16806]